MELHEIAEKQLRDDLSSLYTELGNWAQQEECLTRVEDPGKLMADAYHIYNGSNGVLVKDREVTEEELQSHRDGVDYITNTPSPLMACESGSWAFVYDDNGPEIQRRLYLNVNPEMLGLTVEHLFDRISENHSDFNQFKFARPESIDLRPWLLNRSESIVIYLGKDHDYAMELVDDLKKFNEAHDNNIFKWERPMFTREVSRGIGYAAHPNWESEKRANKILESWDESTGVSFGSMIAIALAFAYDTQDNRFFQDWKNTNHCRILDSAELARSKKVRSGLDSVIDSAYDLLVNDFKHDFQMTQLFLGE